MTTYMHVHNGEVVTYVDECPVCVENGTWEDGVSIEKVPRD